MAIVTHFVTSVDVQAVGIATEVRRIAAVLHHGM